MNIEQIASNYAERKAYEESNKSTKMARFCNTLGQCKYIFKDGHEAYFIGGVYHTNEEQEYYELMSEIQKGHPNIYQEPGKEIVEFHDKKELEDIGRKAIAEFLAQRAASLDKQADRGETDPNARLEGIGNSHSVEEAMAGSSSGVASSVGGESSGTSAGTATIAGAPAQAGTAGLAAALAKVSAAKK